MRTTVFFATNRRVTGDGTLVENYGGGIVAPSSNDQMTFASAFVDGTDLQRDLSGRITSIQGVTSGQFGHDAAGDLGTPGRNILVFIHGFDNSFEDAITRAAFNREWMAASGCVGANMAVVTFSWPSLGRLLDLPLPWSVYQSDQTMAGQSGLHIKGFFERLRPLLLQARAHGSKCYLLCHSMGNWALQAAVESWFAHQDSDAKLFDEAILAAADERHDSFGFPMPGRLSGLTALAGRISVYYSHSDKVLAVSKDVNRMARLGQDGPLNMADPTKFPPSRFRMVDCSSFRDFDFGFASSHQYYRRSPLVRADIASIL